jgi:hypothetical protein
MSGGPVMPRIAQRAAAAVAAAALLLLLVAAPLRAQKVTFGDAEREVGSGRVVETTSVMVMLLNATMSGETRDLNFNSDERSARTETVLAVEDDTVRELRVVLSSFSAKDETPAGDRAAGEAPVLGRPYIVSYTDSGVMYRAEDGDTLSDAESMALRRVYGSGRGFDNGFAGLIAGRSLTVGKSVPVDPERGKALYESMDGTVRDLSLSLQELRTVDGRQVGVFAVTMMMVGQHGPSRFELSLDGQVSVDVERCAPVEARLNGQVVLLADNPDLPMQGQGDFSATLKAAYTP